MKKTINLLLGEFESSCYATPQFKAFTSVFKSEFKKELKTIKAENIVFSVGHFYLSGFFTVGELIYYFDIGDVRMTQRTVLIRVAKDYKDYSGGSNHYFEIKQNMFEDKKLPVR